MNEQYCAPTTLGRRGALRPGHA